MTLRRGISGLCLLGALLLSGCASGLLSEPADAETETAAEADVEQPAAAEPEEGDDAESDEAAEPDAPAAPADSCDWDSARISGGAAASGQEGDLESIVIGAWQHTHIDDGSGFDAVEADIRYVFPSIDRILYCQHVPGITEHAENRGEISWDGTTMVLPTGPGYIVTDWSADTMVWHNLFDDSVYLLQRR